MTNNVFITGGSRGIGAAAVLAFARAGYNVAFTYKSHPDAAACPHPIPVDTRLRDADALGTREHMYGRGMIAYEHAMQWLLDTTPAEQEAA